MKYISWIGWECIVTGNRYGLVKGRITQYVFQIVTHFVCGVTPPLEDVFRFLLEYVVVYTRTLSKPHTPLGNDSPDFECNTLRYVPGSMSEQ